ncbi:MAG: hypothetical protein JWO82_1195, partial [Akkermansiaceae bacterium]|nr:hypothetical protein [Akkermansiaceae bacterium]
LRDSRLALAIIEPIYSEEGQLLKHLEIGAIEWWLDWLADENDANFSYWTKDRLSWLLASQVNEETRQRFVIEFNSPLSKYRALLAKSLLLKMNELTTDDFSEDAISFLLADLRREPTTDSWQGHLLGQTATERFVSERILPLISEAKDLLLSNLKKVLRQAGSRHGRRYMVD